MDQRAFNTVGLLVREMLRNGRHIDFVGLSNTLLTDSDVLYLAGVLESLKPPPLTSLPRNAGIHVRLSAPTGPASRF